MYAATIVDRSLTWTEHPDPVPGTGEVLVRVRSAGINAADLLQVAGFYPAPPGAPKDIPGLELAGEIIGLGPGATRFGVGDRVMAVVGGGAHAEMAVVHERTLIRVPDGVQWEQAGGFPEAFTTAHDALFTQAGLGMGERVCVHGAAGGVGSAAVQLAAAAGADVIATVRHAEHRDAIVALGTHAAGGRGGRVKAVDPVGFEEFGPFDVVLELIGAPNFAADLAALALGGRITVIGVGGGSRVEIDLLAMMPKRGRIHGSTLRSRPLEGKADAARALERNALSRLAEGVLVVPVAASMPMASVSEAYGRFRAGAKLGKIVLL